MINAFVVFIIAVLLYALAAWRRVVVRRARRQYHSDTRRVGLRLAALPDSTKEAAKRAVPLSAWDQIKAAQTRAWAFWGLVQFLARLLGAASLGMLFGQTYLISAPHTHADDAVFAGIFAGLVAMLVLCFARSERTPQYLED